MVFGVWSWSWMCHRSPNFLDHYFIACCIVLCTFVGGPLCMQNTNKIVLILTFSQTMKTLALVHYFCGIQYFPDEGHQPII